MLTDFDEQTGGNPTGREGAPLAARPATRKRDDAAYEIEAVSKAAFVLEVLADEGPVRQARIEKLTKLSRDTVMRTLRTWRLRGYAVQDEKTGEWSLGPRVLKLAGDFHKLCLEALAKQDRVRAFGNSEGGSAS